jgi:hypothetical protein
VTTLDQSQAWNNWSSCTVQSGATWFVPSGTVLRCAGTLTVNGTIEVLTGAAGGSFSDTEIIPSYEAHPGMSPRGATAGGGYGAGSTVGGYGGLGIGVAQARLLLRPGLWGGGGGGSGGTSSSNTGGQGGGTLTILARDGITIQSGAVIRARGAAGMATSGGGGGGVIILTTQGSMNNAGSIDARGGDGGASNSTVGAGGGGGGGVVHLIAAGTITQGTISVVPGTSGSTSIAPGGVVAGGGGGGASCGNGGRGASVSGSTQTFASAADPGCSLVTNKNPALLFW